MRRLAMLTFSLLFACTADVAEDDEKQDDGALEVAREEADAVVSTERGDSSRYPSIEGELVLGERAVLRVGPDKRYAGVHFVLEENTLVNVRAETIGLGGSMIFVYRATDAGRPLGHALASAYAREASSEEGAGIVSFRAPRSGRYVALVRARDADGEVDVEVAIEIARESRKCAPREACGEDEYCHYEPVDSCGAEGRTGECRVPPDLCPLHYRPVCGCDGRTYSNACAANAAGFSVAVESACADAPRS